MSQARPCGSCGTPVLFAIITRRDGGKSSMPVNLKPDMAGNIAATKDVHGQLHGRILKGDDGCETGETRYQTHFASCPASGAHRKRDQPPEQDPEKLLKIARKELAVVQRLAATHHHHCPTPGCGECQRLGAHVHRCERQVQLLAPAVEAPQESLF